MDMDNLISLNYRLIYKCVQYLVYIISSLYSGAVLLRYNNYDEIIDVIEVMLYTL